jgi:tetratricopeptide (TPR) repeat protein
MRYVDCRCGQEVNAADHSAGTQHRRLGVYTDIVFLRHRLMIVCALLAFYENVTAREWTDASGSRKVEAEFVELVGGAVKVKLPSGEIRSVPLARLGAADQDYARHTASASPNSFAGIAAELERSVTAIGYPQSTADGVVQLVRGWKCEAWKQKLAQARASKDTNHIDAVEEQVARGLYETIASQVRPCAMTEIEFMQYFHLQEVARDKKAQCFGYAQLFYFLGRSMGLAVRIIDVSDPVSPPTKLVSAGPVPLATSHAACIMGSTDGQVRIVDLSYRNIKVSRPFVLNERFDRVGVFWELKPDHKSLNLHRRFQVLNDHGITALMYNALSVRAGHAGNHDQEIALLNKAIELAPTYASSYYNRGHTYGELGQTERAIADYSKAIECDPKHVNAYFNRGNHFGESGRYAEAIPNYSAAIELKPEFADAYCRRGQAYGGLEQATEAMADFTKAIELDPKMVQAYLMRGVVYAALGQPDDARSDLRKALALNPGARSRIKPISDQFNLGL